jgi:hypothetical protein
LLTKLKLATALLLAVVVAGVGVMTFAARANQEPRFEKADGPREQARGSRAKAEEKKEVDELTRLYALSDKEDLKCVKPPYSPGREDWLRKAKLDVDPPTNMVCLWSKGELKHWSSILGAPGPDLACLLTCLAPLQPQEIEGDDELLQERFAADFIVRDGSSPEKVVPALEKILRTDFALSVKLTFREVERKVYVASGKYRFVPVKDRPDKRIELYGKKLVSPKFGGHGRGTFADLLRGAGIFVGKRIVAGTIEDLPKGTLQWHVNELAAFTEDELREARDPEAVLKHLSEQTGLTFKEETRKVRVLFVERKE